MIKKNLLWRVAFFCLSISDYTIAAQSFAQPQLPHRLLSSTDNLPKPRELKKLPFVGRRQFNFYGGSGTGYEIKISETGATEVFHIGVCKIGRVYQGPFLDRIKIDDDETITIEGEKVRLIGKGGCKIGSKGEALPCEEKLSPVYEPFLKLGNKKC